jgi:phosphogluconate dehydratase
MPELHQLTPALGSLQSKGFHVALVTDGRMSGASGAVPAAIHVTPECLNNGPLGRVRDGDIIHLDSNHGVLEARVPLAEWEARRSETPDLGHNAHGMGRELFSHFRAIASDAEAGAISFGI